MSIKSKPVVDSPKALSAFGEVLVNKPDPDVPEVTGKVFYNPFPRIVHVDAEGITYGFGPGLNHCPDTELADRLTRIAANYGITLV